MGINAKLKRDINSPDFSTFLPLIQLIWVVVDLTSYHSLNRVDIKSHNPRRIIKILSRLHFFNAQRPAERNCVIGSPYMTYRTTRCNDRERTFRQIRK